MSHTARNRRRRQALLDAFYRLAKYADGALVRMQLGDLPLEDGGAYGVRATPSGPCLHRTQLRRMVALGWVRRVRTKADKGNVRTYQLVGPLDGEEYDD